MALATVVELTFWFSAKDHTADDCATSKVSAHDLHDTHVVDVEVFGIWRHYSQRGLCDEAGELVLVAVLLRGDRGFECGGERSLGEGGRK